MSIEIARTQPLNLGDNPNVPWWVALAGFGAMYVPVYWWAANGIWQSEEHGHGPLILAVLVWLFWTLRKRLIEVVAQPAPAVGWPVFACGILIFILGRAFSISIFELGSQPFVLAGCLLLIKGMPAFRLAWFPILYIIFMIPLPGIFVDTVTGPLKQWVSAIVETILYAGGYPIARTGVTMTIGQYQLLVADACSGLNSMFSLSALGTLFMYITANKSNIHNAIMLASIIPIAFVANIIRVTVLVLVTFHLGDDAGQGFLHSAAGLVLMIAALAIFFALDSMLSLFGRQFARSDQS